MTNYSFYTADVFTHQIFGGNPLAVFPQAEGLSFETMQKIAAEFNLSETVFVFPPQTPQGTKKLRIFTPKTELPFAGHPTVGAAYILAAFGIIPIEKTEFDIIFEEKIGLVPVKIRTMNQKPVYTELTAAQLPEFHSSLPSIEELAAMLYLAPTDVLTGEMSPQAVSCGVPFLFIPLKNREALQKARLNVSLWESLLRQNWANSIYLLTEDPELPESNIRARMFAPIMGIEEDPATGAAVTALGGYLGVRDPLQTGTSTWVIEQGFEMGRPSLLRLEVDKKAGEITLIRVGGATVLVSQGTLTLPDDH